MSIFLQNFLFLYLSKYAMVDKLSDYKEWKQISIRRCTLAEREVKLPRFLSASNRNLNKNIIQKVKFSIIIL